MRFILVWPAYWAQSYLLTSCSTCNHIVTLTEFLHYQPTVVAPPCGSIISTLVIVGTGPNAQADLMGACCYPSTVTFHCRRLTLYFLRYGVIKLWFINPYLPFPCAHQAPPLDNRCWLPSCQWPVAGNYYYLPVIERQTISFYILLRNTSCLSIHSLALMYQVAEFTVVPWV